MIFDLTLPYKVRCNIPECGKPVNHVFRTQLDGMMINFCTPQHAHLGEQRWMEKKEKGIEPGKPLPKEEIDVVSGNTEDL